MSPLYSINHRSPKLSAIYKEWYAITAREVGMNQILAFWVHPRSISTGFERIFIERSDFKVLHEPFSALYYVYEKRVDCPGQHIDPNAPMS